MYLLGNAIASQTENSEQPTIVRLDKNDFSQFLKSAFPYLPPISTLETNIKELPHDFLKPLTILKDPFSAPILMINSLCECIVAIVLVGIDTTTIFHASRKTFDDEIEDFMKDFPNTFTDIYLIASQISDNLDRCHDLSQRIAPKASIHLFSSRKIRVGQHLYIPS